MTRWNFQINAGTVLLTGLLVLAVGVFAARTIGDARRYRAAQQIERQLRGELTEREGRLVGLNRRLQKARSRLVSADELNKRHAATIRDLRVKLGERDLVIERHSQAEFEMRAKVEALQAQTRAVRHEDDGVEYLYRNAWLSFFTPNVFATGGERIELFCIHPRVRIYGIAQQGGVLRSEKIELSFFDEDGALLPFETSLIDYDLEYAPPMVEKSEGGLIDRIHLSVFGHAALGYPIEPLYGRGTVGAELELWGVSIAVWGEADTAWDYRLMAGVGGRWRVF